MGYIYCLFSTRDADPFYVGQTSLISDKRLWHHKSRARNLAGREVGERIRREWLAGYDVEIHELERLDHLLNQRESYWMGQFPNLINKNKSYKTGNTLTPLGADHKQMCRNSIAHIADNYNGYHGVRREEYRREEYVWFCAYLSCIIKEVDKINPRFLDRWGFNKCRDLADALEWRDRLRKQLEDQFTIVSPRPWPTDRPQIVGISDQSASGSLTLRA